MQLAALIVVAALGILAVSKINVWYNYFTVIQDLLEAVDELKSALWPVAKIFIALFQILGGMTNVLNVGFPPSFAEFLRDLKNLLAFINLDVSLFVVSLDIGCLSDGTFFNGLTANWSLVFFVAGITILQYKRAAAKIDRGADTEEEEVEQMKAVFKKFDTDGGGVDIDEVRAIVNKIDHTISDKKVAALFKSADTDGGGTIDFREFYRAAHEHHGPKSNFDLNVLVKKEQKLEAVRSPGPRTANSASVTMPRRPWF